MQARRPASTSQRSKRAGSPRPQAGGAGNRRRSPQRLEVISRSSFWVAGISALELCSTMLSFRQSLQKATRVIVSCKTITRPDVLAPRPLLIWLHIVPVEIPYWKVAFRMHCVAAARSTLCCFCLSRHNVCANQFHCFHRHDGPLRGAGGADA